MKPRRETGGASYAKAIGPYGTEKTGAIPRGRNLSSQAAFLAVSEGEGLDATENPDEEPRALREQAVGHELRRLYEDVAREPIPKSYFELLRRIYDEDWIFPIAWAPEEKPKRLGFLRALREFSLSIGEKLPH
jgi:hypothetical protein